MLKQSQAADIGMIVSTIDPATASLVNPSEVMDIVNRIGATGRTFMLGYRKVDGSFRIFHAKLRASRPYRLSTEPRDTSREEAREAGGLILVYDVDIANRSILSLEKDPGWRAYYDALPEATDEEKEAKKLARETEVEKKLKQAYRSIYPNKIEMIRGDGHTWLVEGASQLEIMELAGRVREQDEEEEAPEEPAACTVQPVIANGHWFARYSSAKD